MAKIKYSAKRGRIMVYNGRSISIHWSKQMVDDLIRLFPRTLNDDLAEYLGVSKSTMLRKAKRLGLRKDADWLRDIYNERRHMALMAAALKGFPGTWQKGVRYNPEGEFKKGHGTDAETEQRRIKAMRKYWHDNPKAAKQRAAKIWATRRANMLKQQNNS